jgi:general stress protein 26
MKILTLATKTKGYLSVLKMLCKKNNHELIVIQYGNKWKGFAWRIKNTLKKIKNIKDTNPNEIIMLIDAYDVLVLSNHEEIINKFYQFNCNVVFSSSSKNSGQPNLSLMYKYILHKRNKIYFKASSDHILNAGSIIGYSKDLYLIWSRMYKRYFQTFDNDDQVLLNNINLKDINYKVDIHSNIFWIWEITTLYELIYLVIYGYLPEYKKNIKYVDGRIYFNQVKPSVIHGIGNRNMDELCKNNKIPTSIISFLFKKNTTQYDLKVLLNFLKIIFLLFLLLILYYIINYLIKFCFRIKRN